MNVTKKRPNANILHTRDVFFFFERALRREREGDFFGAAKDYEDVLTVSPQDVFACFSLGKALVAASMSFQHPHGMFSAQVAVMLCLTLELETSLHLVQLEAQYSDRMDSSSDLALWQEALRRFQDCEAWQNDLTAQGFDPLIHPSDLFAMQGLCTFAIGFLKYEYESGKTRDDSVTDLPAPLSEEDKSSKVEMSNRALDLFSKVVCHAHPNDPVTNA